MCGCRFLTTYSLTGFYNLFRETPHCVSYRDQFILAFSGLRGMTSDGWLNGWLDLCGWTCLKVRSCFSDAPALTHNNTLVGLDWIGLDWYRTYRIRSRVHVAKYHRSQAQVHHCRSGCDLGHCGAYSTSNRIESLSLSLLRALEFRCSPARVLDVPQGMTLRPLISFCRIRRAAI